jgi:lipopolysaccharide assembly outer membrane protein LptD (OstA)
MGAVWFLHHSAVLAQVAFSRPSVSLQEARIVVRERGEKLAEIYAAQVDVSPDARYAIFTGGPTGEVYDHGRPGLRLHADEIVVDRETQDFSAQGRVEITSAQGDRVVGSAARWDNATQRLVLSGGVRVAVGGTDASASRVTVDAGLQTVDLEDGVDILFLRGTLPP